MISILHRRFIHVILLVAWGFMMYSCIGPAGPPGMDGEDGANGANGRDGIDANATCMVCHNNDDLLLARQIEYSYSVHFLGGNYERNDISCAPCHTHKGFLETQASGSWETAKAIEHPTPVNCRTCHMIHVNYDQRDWDLFTTSAVDLRHTSATVDLGESSNICVNCHQARAFEGDPFPEIGGGDVTITSNRYGPHHSPQANLLWGVGGYEVSGMTAYPDPGTNAHASMAGCVVCHMAPVPYGGRSAGGHSLNMTFERYGSEADNIDACTGCHSELETFDHNGIQTSIESLISSLDTIFIQRGWIDAPGELWNVPLTVTANEAGAMVNYRMVLEDRSMGIHNPAYVIALLSNSLETLTD